MPTFGQLFSAPHHVSALLDKLPPNKTTPVDTAAEISSLKEQVAELTADVQALRVDLDTRSSRFITGNDAIRIFSELSRTRKY